MDMDIAVGSVKCVRRGNWVMQFAGWCAESLGLCAQKERVLTARGLGIGAGDELAPGDVREGHHRCLRVRGGEDGEDGWRGDTTGRKNDNLWSVVSGHWCLHGGMYWKLLAPSDADQVGGTHRQPRQEAKAQRLPGWCLSVLPPHSEQLDSQDWGKQVMKSATRIRRRFAAGPPCQNSSPPVAAP